MKPYVAPISDKAASIEISIYAILSAYTELSNLCEEKAEIRSMNMVQRQRYPKHS
jgi:hypothetical protein